MLCALACVPFLLADGWFLYSGDGGLTWTHGSTPLSGYYAMDVSFIDPTHAFAVVDNTLTQESGLAQYI